MIISKIKRIYGKLFIGGHWEVAYRLRGQEDTEYTIVEAPEGTWIADPMLYEYGGEHYLFVELFNQKKDKAGIGYYRFIDGKPVFQKRIIEQPFHLSYPCVFAWQGKHYMIPESAAGKTLDLYRAEHFPDVWEKECSLIKNDKYVDTTIVSYEGNLYALGYHKVGNKWGLRVFLLDLSKKELVFISEELFSENVGRPAGYILEDERLRPAQDCSRLYGEAILWYHIDIIDNTTYKEHFVKKTTVEDLPVDKKADRVHTYSRDSKYEAVDLRYGQFDLLHGFKTIRRALFGTNK